ncbi:MAG: hypothetical protein ACMXX9_04380 [Candidatus Woesearchaeota archaeon]
MSIDDKFFELAKRNAQKEYVNIINKYDARLKKLNYYTKGDKHYVYEETERLIKNLKKLNYSNILLRHYQDLFIHKGLDATKEFLDSKNKLNPNYWFSKKVKAAKKTIKELKKGL